MGKSTGHVLSSINTILKDDKKLKILTVIGLLAIAVIFISTLLPKQDKNTGNQQAVETVTVEQYTVQQEQRVSELISTIEGVGKSKIMLTLENSKEYVYQSEVKKSNDSKTEGTDSKATNSSESTEEKVVLIEGDNGKKQALVKTELPPKVQGVVIVCDGGSSAVVQNRVIDAVTTVFGISSSKVCVVAAQKQQ